MLTPPTPKNIRVTVPVSPQVLARFKRLSKVAGQSVGRAMGEWLEETQEGLDPMIEILERHKKAPLKAIQTLQAYAVTLQDTTADLFDRVNRLDGDGRQLAALAADVPGIVKSSKSALKGVLTPPSSNTGGKGRKTSSKSVGGKK